MKLQNIGNNINNRRIEGIFEFVKLIVFSERKLLDSEVMKIEPRINNDTVPKKLVSGNRKIILQSRPRLLN